MQYVKYLIIALTGILAVACAEEDLYTVGTLDAKATVSGITTTTATIDIDLRDCAELFTDDVLQDYYSYSCYVDLFQDEYKNAKAFEIKSHLGADAPLNLTGTVTFTHLQPSTTYTFCITIPTPLGKMAYRSADFTFTTAPEDYNSVRNTPDQQ